MKEDARVKEKIALTLDARQLVSIVLGSAVLLGIVFYLGVTVGKDLGGAQPPLVAAGDPLERLDQQAALEGQKLTFPEDLTRDEREPEERRAPEPREAKRTEAKEVAEAAAPAGPAASIAPAAAKDPAPADAAAKAEEEASAKPAAASKPPVPRDLSAALAAGSSSQGAAAAPAAGGQGAQAPTPAGAKPSLDVSAALAKVDARKEDKPSIAAPAPAPLTRPGGFTVQVAALPSQREADALVTKLREKGVNASVTVAEIAGRGTFYRVRVGRFGSREEAVRYLEDLRRETRLEGFVASLEN